MVLPHIQPLSKLGGCIVRLANITFEALERVESVDGHEQSNSPTGSQSTTPLNLFAGGCQFDFGQSQRVCNLRGRVRHPACSRSSHAAICFAQHLLGRSLQWEVGT